MAKRLNRKNSSTDSKGREEGGEGLQKINVKADGIQDIHIDIARGTKGGGGAKSNIAIESNRI